MAMMIRSSVVMTLALSSRRAFSDDAGLAAVNGASGVGAVVVIETTAGKMSCSTLIELTAFSLVEQMGGRVVWPWRGR